jgi:hypothetical protein
MVFNLLACWTFMSAHLPDSHSAHITEPIPFSVVGH